MLKGIYSVSFKSSFGNFGSGIAVFTDAGVYGGDDNYFYKASLNITAGELNGDVQVTHYQGQRNSIFGSLDRFTLRVSGIPSEGNLILTGHVVEAPTQKITIECKKISEL